MLVIQSGQALKTWVLEALRPASGVLGLAAAGAGFCGLPAPAGDLDPHPALTALGQIFHGQRVEPIRIALQPRFGQMSRIRSLGIGNPS